MPGGCSNNLADGYGISLMRDMAVNYSTPQSYSLCSDTNNSVRSALKGQRVSHTSARARVCTANLGAQYSSAQEDMVKNFVADDDEADNTVDLSSSGHLTIDPNFSGLVWTDTTGNGICGSSSDSIQPDYVTSSTAKKRSGTDW